MKELSIEQKAKRYDEALKVLHKYDGANIMFSQSLKEEMFPELAESEDDRIRKELIEMVHDTTGDSLWIDYNVHKEDALAWLEKQGEHANFRNKIQIGDKVTRNEDGVLVNLSQLNRVAKKQTEQKLYVNDNAKEMFIKALERVEEQNNKGNKLTDCDKNSWWEDFKAYTSCTIEQKLAAWSEEDELITNKILCICSDFERSFKISPASTKVIKEDVNKIDNWLKSLKDRVQPQSKQEWSEDDMKKISWILAALQNSTMRNSSLKKENEDAENWLKSLRPQKQWKPSDEQMNALNYVVNLMASSERPTENDLYYNILKSLRQQLKKHYL